MAIERIEVVPYALPFREPYVTARGRLDRRELLLVRVVADEGIGLGEAAPLALRGGPALEAIATALTERCAPALRGLPADGPIDNALELCAATGASAQALAAVDIALHDLAGKLAGKPVWELLGASSSLPVPCNATLVAGEPAAVAADAQRWAERDFSSYKLKVGVPDDVEQVAAVREAVGGAARIRVDANGAWSPEQAVERLRVMAGQRLELTEQPVATLEQMVALRVELKLPLAADESVASTADAARAVELGACDAATVKLAKVGGIRAALAIAEQLPVYLSSALDGPIGIAAATHAYQAMSRPGIAAGLAQGLATQLLFDGTIATSECTLDGPNLNLPPGPGLGVEIDEGLLRRYAL